MTMERNDTETTFWADRAIGPAWFLRGRFRRFNYDVHSHDSACLALIIDGAIRIRSGGGEFTARTGDIYAIEADVPHSGFATDGDGWSLRTVYVDLDHFRAAWREEFGARIGRLNGPLIRDPGLSDALLELHRRSEADGTSLERSRFLISFLETLFERHTRAPTTIEIGAESAAVRAAREFLDERLDARVHLAEIANAAGLPPFRLHRAFTRSLGVSPHVYQRLARIRRATAMLRTGVPVCEVAAATGFADQAHLTRTLKSTLATTPAAYRRAFLPDPR